MDGEIVGSVWDRECQGWAEIREFDGKLYGFPDSARDGTPAGVVAFVGPFDPKPHRFYIGNVLKAPHGRIGIVAQADSQEAAIKGLDGVVYYYLNEDLEVLPEGEMPHATQPCETCKEIVPINPWFDGPVWCIDCYNHQQA